MVQYIHTPWRDRAELLKVRRQFYPVSGAAVDFTKTGPLTTSSEESQQQNAVARVSMWMQRGGCPHLVESTALLTAAALSDAREARDKANFSSSSYAVRAAYAAAFGRFVTGLLDSQQDKQRKMSMYSVAKTIGLPATFVELRHQATHEQLPSLLKLRSAAQKALVWIWDYYWKDLTDGRNDGRSGGGNDMLTSGSPSDTCRATLLQVLDGDDKGDELQACLSRWGEPTILRTLGEISSSAEEPRVLLRSLQLSRDILSGPRGDGTAARATKRNLEAIRSEVESSTSTLEAMPDVPMASVRPATAEQAQTEEPGEEGKGWVRYEGQWKPKPIGVV